MEFRWTDRDEAREWVVFRAGCRTRLWHRNCSNAYVGFRRFLRPADLQPRREQETLQRAPLAGPGSTEPIQEASDWPLGRCRPFLGEGEWPAVFLRSALPHLSCSCFARPHAVGCGSLGQSPSATTDSAALTRLCTGRLRTQEAPQRAVTPASRLLQKRETSGVPEGLRCLAEGKPSPQWPLETTILPGNKQVAFGRPVRQRCRAGSGLQRSAGKSAVGEPQAEARASNAL